jgi:hypothetical protein
MHSNALPLILIGLLPAIDAAPLQLSPPASRSTWSNEAIIALVAVFVSLCGILITLASSPKFRSKFKRTSPHRS